MNTKNEIELTARYYGRKTITAIYKGAHLIWEAINSCFGSGCWIKDKPWNKDDAWRRN